MNWLEGIQEAIAYIEDNLTEQLKIGDIAAKAYSSETCFQKTFALLCGFNVGEYIRNRRLSSAGSDLLTTDEKVIDLALKYGYESTDGFTKAFTRFHGATPTAVRKHGRPIRSFAPIKLELFVKGGFIMDYRLQKQKPFKAKVRVNREDKTVEIIKEGNRSDFDLLYIESILRGEHPGYAIRRILIGEAGDLAEYDVVASPEVLWAVFGCRGTSRDDAREQTIRRIFGEWFPQTGYEPLNDSRNVLHLYSGVDKEDYGEIRIPVKEKRV